jgi:hypothetical protein
MPSGGSILEKFVRSPGGFLYLNRQNFLEIFCYYFIEYIMYPFGLHLFSFFNVNDSQVWTFDGVAELLHIPFTALELFDYYLLLLLLLLLFFHFCFIFEL